MSVWSHSICEDCWDKKNPERKAVRARIPLADDPEKCCYCGAEHFSRIYVRENPENVPCKGQHD